MASGTITITKYEIDKIVENEITFKTKPQTITYQEFVNILNSIDSSTNSIDVANCVGCSNPVFRSYTTQYSLMYWNIFRGNITNNKTLETLKYIKSDVMPKNISSIRKSIMIIKMKIYEFKQKMQYDEDSAEWIGMLSGLLLYLDEVDNINFGQTQLLKGVSKEFTVRDISDI
jgi:hypothetical protein